MKFYAVLLSVTFISAMAFNCFADETKTMDCCKKDANSKTMATCENCYGDMKCDVKTVKLADLKVSPDTVAVEGTVTTVCQAAGCWVMIKDGDKTLFVKAKGESFYMPKNAAGAKARAYGVIKEVELTEESQKHFASEGMNLGEIKGSRKIMMMVASGVQHTPMEGQKLDDVKKYKCEDGDSKSEMKEMKKEEKKDNKDGTAK